MQISEELLSCAERVLPTRPAGIVARYVEAVRAMSEADPASREYRRAAADVRALASRIRTLALLDRATPRCAPLTPGTALLN